MVDQRAIKNTGKDSESTFCDNMAERKAAVFRLRDAADLYGINKRKVGAFEMPADYIVVCPRGMFFAEVKSSHNKTSFSLGSLSRGQKAAAAKCHIAHSGGAYRIYIHNMNTDQWYIMDGSTYVLLIKQGIKSVKWQNLTPLQYWLI